MRFHAPLEDANDLNAGYASSATEDESRECRNSCKNPTHYEPPFAWASACYSATDLLA